MRNFRDIIRVSKRAIKGVGAIFLDKIFKRKKTATHAVNINNGAFSSWGGNAYENDVYREAVDSIARNVGKLKGTYIIKNGNSKRPGNDARLNRLLQIAPNKYMSAYDYLYKITTHLFLYNNSFSLLDKDDRGNVLAIYPITCNNAQFLEDERGELFIRFYLNNGKQFISPYSNIIHLRRNFNSNELLGDNNSALYSTIELAEAQAQGLTNAIKSSASIRGILKFENVIAPNLMKQQKEEFVNDYLSIENSSGIVAVDNKSTYTPIQNNPNIIDGDQMREVKTKVFNYLGISESIVNSSYNEDQWGAFYESIIEPLAVQLSLEFTKKIFNEREIAFGNEIVFDSGRLIYSSNATKVNMVQNLLPMGIFTLNEAREIFNLAPLEGGDKRLQSLNYIDQEKANEYQLGGGNNEGS